MRILFLGDIVGRSGREAVLKHLPTLKEKAKPDFIIINVENAAHGAGVTKSICQAMFDAGADVLTSGNHIWDQKEVMFFIDKEDRLLRPVNYPKQTPGRGYGVYSARNGKKVLVINAMARLFMDPLDDPFAQVNDIVAQHPLGKSVDAIALDFHGETTSEKMAMGHFLDGKVTFVVGTHTHIPTADTRVLPGGTGYQTDAGMCGDYNSVIGMKKDVPIARFTRKISPGRLEPADREGTVCGLFIESDDTTGLAKRAEMVRLGPNLSSNIPE